MANRADPTNPQGITPTPRRMHQAGYQGGLRTEGPGICFIPKPDPDHGQLHTKTFGYVANGSEFRIIAYVGDNGVELVAPATLFWIDDTGTPHNDPCNSIIEAIDLAERIAGGVS